MTNHEDDRREFLKTCGRFAAVTPPALTLLLSTSLTSDAIANSGGGPAKGKGKGGGNGNGNGKGHGGHNGKHDRDG